MQFKVAREVVAMLVERFCHPRTRLALGSGDKGGEAGKPRH
jgi:hypothetical protein